MIDYPGADQSRRYDRAYPGLFVAAPARGVLHTTETTGLPSYSGGAMAPNMTIDPRRRKRYQHFAFNRGGRALQHPAGTIDTNNLTCIQFEIVAYSDETIARQVGGVAVSDLTTDDLDFIAETMRWTEEQCGIPRASGLTWKAYPASAGSANGVRMSSSQWARFSGWCGHQHVPNNDHGDPSDLDIAYLLGEDDMTPEQMDQLVERVAQRAKELILIQTGTEAFGGTKPEGLVTGLSRGYRTSVATLLEGRASSKALAGQVTDLGKQLDQSVVDLSSRIDQVAAQILPAVQQALAGTDKIDMTATVNVNGKVVTQ